LPGTEVPAAPVHRDKPLTKPPVRWLARTLGVDLAQVRPSGGRGEVTREDVRAVVEEGRGTGRLRAAGEGDAGRAPAAAESREEVEEVEEIEVVGIRARIAERMSASRSTIPEATCGLWVDFERLLELRGTLRDDIGDAGADFLTPFALLAWMVPAALQASPLLNSTYDGTRKVIRVHRHVHLGIATSTGHGLLVPVVRDADALSLVEFASELARLGRRARDGSLAPGELMGSTFTLTNYGTLGLDDGNPVINAPEAAILGVGTVRERAVVWEGNLAARRTAKLICAFDHRVVDGAEAAAFLGRLRATVERPELLLARG